MHHPSSYLLGFPLPAYRELPFDEEPRYAEGGQRCKSSVQITMVQNLDISDEVKEGPGAKSEYSKKYLSLTKDTLLIPKIDL